MVYDAELRQRVLPILEDTDYEHLATAPLFRAMLERLSGGFEFELEEMRESIGDDEFLQDLIPLLLMTEAKRQPGEVIDEVFQQAENCIFSLRSMAINNRIFDISQELIAAERAGDAVSVSQLVAEQLDLARMKHDLITKLREI
jgi:hypothetical protein